MPASLSKKTASTLKPVIPKAKQPLLLDIKTQQRISVDMTSKDQSRFSLISLFSGAGGMDIGFKKAGFKTIWANEFDKTISPSYCNYFKDVWFDGRSITDIPDSDIPKATGVIGGPPCQSWSEAGAKRGIDDPKGKLFHEYIRVITNVKPLFFVAENVHGLIHARNRNSFDEIIHKLEQCGYVVSWQLLKASDYDVPQDRERVFIVGYHVSLGKKFIFPPKTNKKASLSDAIGDLHNITIGNPLIPNHEVSTTGFSPIFMSRNRVRGWDEPSYTILACDRHIPLHPQAPKMIPTGTGEMKKFVDGFESMYRRLTIRECARIQTFPDDYTFIYNHVRNGYKMVGNAVPINLAYHIAKTIKNDLEEVFNGDSN